MVHFVLQLSSRQACPIRARQVVPTPDSSPVTPGFIGPQPSVNIPVSRVTSVGLYWGVPGLLSKLLSLLAQISFCHFRVLNGARSLDRLTPRQVNRNSRRSFPSAKGYRVLIFATAGGSFQNLTIKSETKSCHVPIQVYPIEHRPSPALTVPNKAR